MPDATLQKRRWLFMSPLDIGLFLRSARTDAAIARLRATQGARAAFEAAYAGGADPWASADPRYFYQRWKYETLMALLPPGRRFTRALDLGCGTGTLSLALTRVADEVIGLDIAQSALDKAVLRAGETPGLSFLQGDVTTLDPSLDGRFDLVVIADTLYYLDALDDLSLKNLASRISRLLAPGGMCLLANHYFAAADKDSKLTRRIHDAFAWSPSFVLVSSHRRPFYLVSLLEPAGRKSAAPSASPAHPEPALQVPKDF